MNRPSLRFLASIGLVAASWIVLRAPAPADVVRLRDGMEFRGRVVELGGNSIELHQRAGASRRIPLKQVEKATFDLEAQALPRDQDLVFRKNGVELRGDVTLAGDGKTVVISQPGGTVVKVPRAEVARIVYRDQARGEDWAAVYSARTRDDVQAAIKLLAAGGDAALEAEEKLRSYGIFAIAAVEEARAAAREGSPSRKALDRVARHYKLREITSDSLQELTDYYAILSGGTMEEKRGLLEEMFTRYVDDSVPVAKFLVRDPDEDPAVRAWAIDLLGRMQRNRDLVDIFNDPAGGQVQLAAAIALARNRLLVGAESLIEALELDERGVRDLAIRALKDAVGQDFGYAADDTPSSRKDAIGRWKRWWGVNRTEIQGLTSSILSGNHPAGESPQRRKAVTLWKKGSLDWEGGKLPAAETSLRAAMKADPTFYNAQVSLAVLLYLHREKGEEARKLLEDLVSRRIEEMRPADAVWVHYHLGRAHELAGDLERADREHRRALGIDRAFFRAAAALGDLKFRQATAGEGLTPEARRGFLRDAEAEYQAALAMVENQSGTLEILSVGDLPVESAPVFERQEHNRGVLSVKANLRRRKAELHFAMAKARSLLDDMGRALDEATTAIEALGEDRDGGARSLLVALHNYRGFLYEEAGEAARALREYRTVIRQDLDPRNEVALEGIRRLEARISPRATRQIRDRR